MSKVKFEIEDKEYTLPDYVTIGKYVEIFKVKDLFEDKYLSAKIVSKLSDCPIDELLNVNYQQVEYLGNYAMRLFPTGKPVFEDRFQLNGVWYGFIPEWKKISFAEFVDLDTLFGKKRNEILDYLHILTAIMYRPIINDPSLPKYEIEKYDVDSMEDRAYLFKNELNIRYFLGGQFFFINFARNYSNHIQQYLKGNTTLMQKIKFLWRWRKMIWTVLFKKDSDGSRLSTELLTMTLQSTKQSLKSRWLKFLINLATLLPRKKKLKKIENNN
jgi:hypothetical protein